MNLAEKDLQYIWHPCSQMKDYESLLRLLLTMPKEFIYMMLTETVIWILSALGGVIFWDIVTNVLIWL